MKYDDFPILTNHEYETLNSQFLENTNPNRKDLLNEICQDLSNCSSSCLNLFSEHNQGIKQSLTLTNKTLTKLFNNLTTTFDLNPIKTYVSNTNIFNLLSRLIKIISNIQKWLQLEEKTYYKSLATKSLNEIILCANSILSALENSNIKLFKHM